MAMLRAFVLRFAAALGGWHYVSPDGRIRPFIRGGDGAVTVQDLVDERARVVTRQTDIMETARARITDEQPTLRLEDAERSEYDELTAEFDRLTAEINQAVADDGDAQRSEQFERRMQIGVPNINRITEDPVRANRSLDELLWATAEDVPAGSYGKTGLFSQHATARNAVEQVAVRSESGDAVLAPRINEFRPEHRSAVRSFQRLVSDMTLFGMMVDSSV